MDPSANTSPLLSVLGSVQPRRGVHINISFGKFAVTRISTIRGKFFTWIAIFYMEKAIKGEPTLSLSHSCPLSSPLSQSFQRGWFIPQPSTSK